ncbi:MAG TPA: type II secretion system protein GspC [Thermodesulfobacteriota bacterium]|nr:type II secretion system protein GspC [Thermodesulfobacteriota bacterium]
MLVTLLKKYVWVINLLLLTGLAYLAALTVNQKLEGVVSSPGAIASQKLDQGNPGRQRDTSVRRPRSYYDLILTRNIFGISNLSDASAPADGGPGPGSDEALPDSTLNIVLLGTIINPDAPSVAIIKNPGNNKVQGYTSGEQIKIIDTERVNLVQVMGCKAVIQRQKGHETIKCKNIGEEVASSKPMATNANRTVQPAGKGGEQTEEGINKISDNEYEISRELLEDVLSDPTNIVQQARVIPQQDGLRFFGIRSNSIFWKIGIKNGDTLHRINNVELNDVERALGIFEELRSQSSFTIDFTRAGKQYSYQYVVK